MQHTIKRFFAMPRNRIIDVSTYVRSCSALALRDPEIFLEVTKSICVLGSPYSSAPHISLKPEPLTNDGKKGETDVAESTEIELMASTKTINASPASLVAPDPQTPAKEPNKFEAGTLNFLLNDLITSKTIAPPPNQLDPSPNHISLCTWAIRAIKDPPSAENTDARYGRLLATTHIARKELCRHSYHCSLGYRSQLSKHTSPHTIHAQTTGTSDQTCNQDESVDRQTQGHKDTADGFKLETESSLSSDDDEDEDSDVDRDGREESPDLYPEIRLLGCMEAKSTHLVGKEMDDAHYGGDDDMDEDADEEEDVKMDFGDDTGSEHTSHTEDEVDEGVDDETRTGEDWGEGDDDDDLVENEEDEDEEADEDEEDQQDDDGADEVDDVMWQDIHGDIDGVRIDRGDLDEDDEHPTSVPIPILHEEDQGEDMGSEEDYSIENAVVPNMEEMFGFDAFLSGINRDGGIFVQRRRDAMDDSIFGRPSNAAIQPSVTTHPLLLDTSSAGNHASSSSNRPRIARHSQRLIADGGVGGTETIRLEVPAGAVVNLDQGYVQHRRGMHGFSAHIRVDPPPGSNNRVGRDLDPLLTGQRWGQEVKILNGDFIAERVTKLTKHVILALLPAAVEAIRVAQALEEQEKKDREEATARAKAELEEKASAEAQESQATAPEPSQQPDSIAPVAATDESQDQSMEDATGNEANDETDASADSEAGPLSQPAGSSAPSERITVMIFVTSVLPESYNKKRYSERPHPPTGGPVEIDNASFLASLDPTLRQTVLMEQDEGFIQTLPSHILAEVGAFRDDRESSRRLGRSSAATRSVPQAAQANKKVAPSHDAIQLLDKVGVAVLVRLLFFPQVLKKTLLYRVLVNLCENARTRTELFNLLLNILQDGTGDLASVDKSFSQMYVRNTKTPTAKSLGKQKASPEYLAALALNSQTEVVPDFVVQRCLEALTFIVTYLYQHELPAGLRRSASREKAKGKRSRYLRLIILSVLLLGLLDRESLLKTPAIMKSVVGLLATLKDKKSGTDTQPESSTSKPPITETGPARVPEADTIQPELSSSSAPRDATTLTSGEITGTAAQPQTSIEAVEEKILLANPPQIPHAVLRFIVNILTVGECSGRTFQQSLALIQQISYIPEARDLWWDEGVFGRKDNEGMEEERDRKQMVDEPTLILGDEALRESPSTVSSPEPELEMKSRLAPLVVMNRTSSPAMGPVLEEEDEEEEAEEREKEKEKLRKEAAGLSSSTSTSTDTCADGFKFESSAATHGRVTRSNAFRTRSHTTT
ncbi:hypothetical protein H0H93_016649 [Arthromyces matolae]|nr:hypothetical protein H0H93_016649 [Arthromyces matolae]